MSIEIARYQFHSYARKGLSKQITDADDLGMGTNTKKERAGVTVDVSLNSEIIPKSFELIGPGEIVGINPDMVVRTEPRHWISDFESNYLAFIEFYDEDFAWRYTPAGATGNTLRPWIFLLVLKPGEFEKTKRRTPLPSIVVKDKNAFPPANETWLWAHVHSNAGIPVGELSEYEKFLASLNKTMNNDPDQFYSRLISPRKLEPNTDYFAFLVPAFETGRLAGLDEPVKDVVAQLASWDINGAKGEMPVYYEWFFHTGSDDNFEKLVKRLQPQPMKPEVGIRDMDVHQPGFFRSDGTIGLPSVSPELIGLEGALKSPDTVSTKFPHPPGANAFQEELEKIVNLPYDIISNDTSKDPVISMPMYGGNHAKQNAADKVRLNVASEEWVQDLNRDPRTRVAAGFGTRVIQKNQEDYMRKAWQQVTTVMEANKRIRHALLYMNVALHFTRQTVSQLTPSKLLAFNKQLLPKVLGSPTTILHQVQVSRLPAAALSGAFRRLVRPGGAFAKKLGSKRQFDYESLVTRLNNGDVTAAPPKVKPAALPNTEDIAGQLFSHNYPGWLVWLLRNRKWVFIVLLVLLLLIALLTGAWLLIAVIAAAAMAGYVAAGTPGAAIAAADDLKDPARLKASVASVPPQPNFTLRLPGEPPLTPTPGTAGGRDSVEAARFRSALADFAHRISLPVPEKKTEPFLLQRAARSLYQAIHPHTSFPSRLRYYVTFPKYIDLSGPQTIYEAMAYPDFPDPMYKKLVELSEELLIPNLKLIPQNCISLLKTNQKFIESYMVGLNHEMGNELLWREYPSDQRGSYFRQFWDVNGVIRPKENKDPAQLTEEYKDIDPIHTWRPSSKLGTHNKRDKQGDTEQTVLVIRGDLLKRYPNTVIFAQKAVKGSLPDEPVINTSLTDDQFDKEVRFPIYKASISPDIQLFGFDLKIEEAKGSVLTAGFEDKLGWFFVIQEVPGEPRFGMDSIYDPGSDGLSWDDLAWDHLPADTKFITRSHTPDIPLPDKSKWVLDAANMADVLFQKPSMVAIHAAEMLDKLTDKKTI